MHRQIAGRLTGRVTKWLVLGFWLVAVVALAPLAGKLTDVQNNETSSWLPDSAESTRALAKLEAFQDPNAIPTVIVYERTSGLTRQDFAAATTQAKELATLDGVSGPVVGPIPAKDGQAMQTVVTFDLGKNGWSLMPDTVDRIREIAPEGDGLTVHVTGAGGQAADSAAAFEGLDSTLIYASAMVVIIILLLTYRSPTLWLLPVFSAVVSLVVAQALVYVLAKYADLTVNGQSQAILTVLVFGAGTDYALLLVARYREELRRHEDRHEAMAFALHRAAPAIFASASTVILGMLTLTLAELNSSAGLGPVSAVGVAVALLVMITLLPALLVIFGRWVFWPKRPWFGSPEPTTTGFWARVGRRIARAPRRVWVVTAILLAVAGLGITKLDANGLTTEESYTKEFDSVVGQKVLTRHGLADESNPVLVVANAEKSAEVQGAMNRLNGIGELSTPVVKDGVVFLSAPIEGDATAPSAFETVDKVREAVHAVDGADALVSGTSAIFDDVEKASQRDNRVVIPAVLLVVLMVLIVLLRALVSPLLLIGTVVLSFAAALGLSALLFTYVFGFAGTDASIPLFVFVFLVALGIDYNIFLMTRVREETQTRGTRQGSLVALAATGGVITSAGIVLASTFLVLSTMPLVAFVEVGVAVALGVLLDTLVVRSVLVTALNLDLGSRIWWPSRLDRSPPVEALDGTAEGVLPGGGFQTEDAGRR
ncbi:MAG TPA: MMPL family transporter [Nocardioides sp.]|uniref:MMPL family transporter n=1 Tax=Nocardioides sp. TaxID=35761 RepID=UPI002C8D5A5B|nr:MMPL family transporter [Nocardioides sp.]HQR28026.1 MMPL family transporter [Nocardioides sp.]